MLFAGFLSLALNFPLNIGVTMSNKAFFKYLSFKLPVTLASIHMLFCAVIPLVLNASGLTNIKPPSGVSRKQKIREWLLALVWALHIAMSNIGLKSVSVHLFVLVKCAGPVASAILTYFMLKRKISDKSIAGLILLVLGPALAVHAEVDVTLFGVLATVSVVFLTSLKVVLSTLLFTSSVKWESLTLLSAMSPKACLLLLPWASYEIFSNEEAMYQVSHLEGYMFVLLSLSGVFAFFLNYNNFMIFKYMDSPVSVAVFTNVRKVLTIVVSVMVFERELNVVNVAGTVTTFLGVALYSYQEMEAKKRKRKHSTLEIV